MLVLCLFVLISKTLVNASVLPLCSYLTDKRLRHTSIRNDGFNPAKANGPDGISARMIIICDESLVLPFRKILTNILTTGIYTLMSGNLSMSR